MVVIKYKRPEVIRKYKKQLQFIDAPTKHAIIEATSKAGKTTGCVVWLFEQALAPYPSFSVNAAGKLVSNTGKTTHDKTGFNYWWVAPVYSQAKIAFTRMKRYIKPKTLYTANETELSITLRNGAKIWFKSAEKPDNLYGDDVYAAVLDEATRMKEAAYIAVDSTLSATEGPLRIIGNVKGIGNWAYALARDVEAKKLNDWTYFKLTAADAVEAGVLKQKVLDEKRQRLPEGIFLELYYAIPFVNSANKFAYCFDPKKHVKSCKLDLNHTVYLSFDFNRNPITCTIIQFIDGVIRVPRVVKLENSNIYKLCEYLNTLLYDNPEGIEPDIVVNGDASGNAGSALVTDGKTYFTIIKSKMRLGRGQMKQSKRNPKIRNNQVLVNAVLEHVPIEIDPNDAQPLINDLQFAEMLPDGTLKKTDRNDPKQQLDALDTFRYYCNSNHKDYAKGYDDGYEYDEEAA